MRRLCAALPALLPLAGTAATGPALVVDTGAGLHAISDDIYGMNFAAEDLALELALPVRRWGGNGTTRYNWQIDTGNTGNDWYFENIPNPLPQGRTLPDGSAADQFVEQDRRTGTRTLITLPMAGWVANRRPPGDTHPYDCGFQVSRYGSQQSTDPWDANCGNGVRGDGSLIRGNDPADTSTAADPSFAQAWIGHLVGHYGSAAAGGVAWYELDNEPELWSSTHRDVRPQHLGYDELASRSTALAAAVKGTDAGAQVIGPSSWGWTAYFYSDLDQSQGGDWWNHPKDRLAHGNVPLAEWYLQQMRGYEQQHGVRLLDYVDEHYYPQAAGVFAGATDPATDALRLRSTRSLWDPTYTDESWIAQPVRLLPMMHDWVAADYPGTRIAISEYSFGALGDINGALAQADVLGILGREGADLATLWGPPASGDPGAYAFRMYRNVDGHGGRFGNSGVLATSADPGRVSVFAARRGAKGTLTVIAINKTGGKMTSTLTLKNYAAGAIAQAWRYSGTDVHAIHRLKAVALAGGTLAASLPANSITLYVVPPAK